MPRLDAPSISWTSMEMPSVISLQFAQPLQGISEGPFSQLRALARIRATEVFPTPRGPLKMKAWATRPRRIALRRVVTT